MLLSVFTYFANQSLLTDLRISQATATVDSGLLLMAVMGLLLPAVLHGTDTEINKGESELDLSRFSSCVMLVAYTSYIFYQLRREESPIIEADEVGSFFLFAEFQGKKGKKDI